MGIFNLNTLKDVDLENDGSNTVVIDEKEGKVDVPIAQKVVENTSEKAKESIVLDGPLSHIYTQALNMVYGNEGTSTMVSILEAKHHSLINGDSEADRMEAGNSVTDKGTYVYCIDATDMDAQGLVTSTECLREVVKSGKYSNVILAMESSNINSKMQLLGEMGTALGIKVVNSRSKAMTVLSSF